MFWKLFFGGKIQYSIHNPWIFNFTAMIFDPDVSEGDV